MYDIQAAWKLLLKGLLIHTSKGCILLVQPPGMTAVDMFECIPHQQSFLHVKAKPFAAKFLSR